MALTWYVLQSKPNKEEFFWGELIAHFIEVYYPCIQAKAANPHAYKDKPYLPGHLFIHVDLQVQSPDIFKNMPGSRGLVTCGDQPAPVPEALITIIRQHVNRINATGGEKIPGMSAGVAFARPDFPLTGYKTFFDGCLSGEERVRRLRGLLRGELQPVDLPGQERNI
jgi:transcription antitermination factor NusG